MSEASIITRPLPFQVWSKSEESGKNAGGPTKLPQTDDAVEGRKKAPKIPVPFLQNSGDEASFMEFRTCVFLRVLADVSLFYGILGAFFEFCPTNFV